MVGCDGAVGTVTLNGCLWSDWDMSHVEIRIRLILTSKFITVNIEASRKSLLLAKFVPVKC